MDRNEITNIILDTDPGVDDAVSFFVLKQSEKINIKLIVASAGNLGVDCTYQNAKYLSNRFKIEAPIVCGSSSPIKRGLKIAEGVHGKMGLGGFMYTPEPMINVDRDYCSAIKKTLDENEDVVYLCLGPMTNLANFILKYPEYKNKINKVVFMGGDKDKIDEETPYPEFNISVDPEAVDIVLNSGMNLVMVPMNLGHFAYFTEADVERFASLNQLGKDFKLMFSEYKDGHVPVGNVATHDVCACVYLINSKFYKFVDAHIELKYFPKLGTGCIDNDLTRLDAPRATLAIDINENKFKELFFNYLKNYQE